MTTPKGHHVHKHVTASALRIQQHKAAARAAALQVAADRAQQQEEEASKSETVDTAHNPQ